MIASTDVGRAVEALDHGGLVALPTETVYGLAADATQPAAIERIFEVKGRPTHHPLIVHVGDIGGLAACAATVPETAARLVAEFWPGPLTVIVPRGDLDPLVAGGRDTIGVRMPAHPLATAVLDRLGRPVAAPSANRFGAVSPTTAQHVVDDLGPVLDNGRDLVLDGGPCRVGIESTIVDCTVDPPQILRAGAVTADQINGALDVVHDPASGPARASGMLPSHYAPDAAVELAADRTAAEEVVRAAEETGRRVGLLDRSDDLDAYARDLYGDLRRLDRDGCELIVAVVPPQNGIGTAIADRLRKAAGPRPNTVA
ncbi:MAG: L-threonylcarbamoyladenylate synthase [Actinomycetota bacterium]